MLIESLRATEFGRLDRAGLAYLDYTGAALYTERQIRRHSERLASRVFGNPHSESDASRASTDAIETARARVLGFLDADPALYTVIFTANCSAAIKLVAESYPFGRYGRLLLSADNHNSVNGIREYARRARTSVEYLPLDDELRLLDPARHMPIVRRRGARLLAVPAQSNFSGVHHPLSLIELGQEHGFDVLLDAASFVASNPLSLREHHPEFVALSFYKLFGFPGGVGALIARRDALAKLRRPWFAGGTVDFASVQNGIHQLRAAPDAFEDGTPNFLDIAALADGFDLLEGVGVSRIHGHVAELTSMLLAGLQSMTHDTGQSAVVIHGPRDGWMRGGTVAFNVVDRSGRVIPYGEIERRARDAGIAVRGGCFCNPGAAEAAFHFDAIRAHDCMTHASRDGFTIDRFAECLGHTTPVGAVRASMGLANTQDDVARLIELVRLVVTGTSPATRVHHRLEGIRSA